MKSLYSIVCHSSMLRILIVLISDVCLIVAQRSMTHDSYGIHQLVTPAELIRKKVHIGYTLPTPMAETSTTTEKVCMDRTNMCCFWATAGECEKNLFWMRLHCPVTCGTCSCKGPHADKCDSIGVMCVTTTPVTTTTTPATTMTTTSMTTIPPTTEQPVTKAKKNRPYTPPPNGFARTRRTSPSPMKFDVENDLLMNTTSQTVTSTVKLTTSSPTTRMTSTTTTTTESPYACKDFDSLCSFWVKYGECQKNNHWMNENCQLSCGTCSNVIEKRKLPINVKSCINLHLSCDYWSSRGECVKNANWMSVNCPKSCRFCVSPKP